MRKACVVIALWATSVPGASAQEAPLDALAFVGATLVDVRTGTVHPGTTLVIRGNRIAAVGPSSTTPVPRDFRVVDAAGMYLIPGLIDTHVHLGGQWRMQPADTLAQLGWFVASGVTTVRDASSFDLEANLVALREANAVGRILAPRIYISAIPYRRLRERLGATTIVEAIRRYDEAGLQAVKITNQAAEEALETIRAAVAAGLPVWGHTSYFTEDGRIENYTLAAVRAGISGVSHTTYIYLVRPERDRRPPRRGPDGEWGSWRKWRLHLVTGWQRADPLDVRAVITAMVARGVWLEPTLTATRLEYDVGRYDATALSRYHTWMDGQPMFRWWERPRFAAAWKAMARFVRDFHEAGGIVVASSDHDAPFPPLGVTEEMRLLVEAGLSPLAALQAATVNAALALDLGDQIGTVEEGKLADLVLLDADPLADITNVRKVVAVVANGRLLDRRILDRLLMRRGTPRGR